jgi:hypothetical protein
VTHSDDGTVTSTHCCSVTAPRPQWVLPVDITSLLIRFFVEKSMDPRPPAVHKERYSCGYCYECNRLKVLDKLIREFLLIPLSSFIHV